MFVRPLEVDNAAIHIMVITPITPHDANGFSGTVRDVVKKIEWMTNAMIM